VPPHGTSDLRPRMIPSPDMTTVFVVCGTINLVLSLGLLLVYSTSRTYPGFRQWVLASASALVSISLLSFRNWLPPQPVTILVNLTFFGYPLLLARGFRLFIGQSTKDWIAYVSLALVTAIALSLIYIWPQPNLRVLLLSLLLVPLFADCGWLVSRVGHFAHPAVKGSLIAIFAVMTLWNLLRSPLALALQSWSGSANVTPFLTATTLVLLTSANLGVSLGVILLNYARASDSLRESEERFRSAMQRAPIGMALVTLDGQWIEVNPALCTILGRDRDDLLGRNFKSVTHPDDRLTDEQSIGRLVAREVPSYYREKRYLHKLGHLIWVHVHVSIIFHSDGSPSHLVSQIIDVTARKQTEEALREYQAKLIQAMDAAKLGHWEFDLASNSFTFDENFYKLLGTSSVREGGTRMGAEEYTRRFLPPEEAGRVAEETARALASNDPHYTRISEHRFLRADGSTGVVSVRFAIERDASGRPVKAFGLSQDVTDQARATEQHRRLEEQLRHAQKMDALGTLAGGIAHDFNNILTGIMGNLQLARLDLPPDHPVVARLEEAEKASRRARDHVARVLTFSRRYQGDRAAKSLGPVVQEAVNLLRASLPVSIDIRTAIAADCPAVVCDSAQIHQVIMNLGTNAAHAMRARGGVLEIRLEAVMPDAQLLKQHPQVNGSHRVRLVVRDTGTGIDEAVLSRIFEPFFTTKAPDEGTGLGLAMVHGIIQDHQGAITVTSQPGQGTTFSLYFPPAAETAATPAAPELPAPLPPTRPQAFGNGRKVMLVDDDDAVLHLGQAILKLSGFTVEAYASPVAAHRRFQAEPSDYAAVISDLTMPGMSGVDLARRVRAIRPDIPFILSSGYLHVDGQGGAQESGITHFIRKPFDIGEFTQKLRSALEPGAPT
jgi:PAS domain S-box-containing protein